MANQTLPSLTAATALVDADLLLTRKNGDTADKKITAANARAYMSANSAAKAQTASFSGLIPTPVNGTYVLILEASFAGTIKRTVTECTSGTASARFRVNSTDVGTTANSVSTTKQSQTHTTANSFLAGDKIAIVISSASSCQNLAFTVEFDLNLA